MDETHKYNMEVDTSVYSMILSIEGSKSGETNIQC